MDHELSTLPSLHPFVRILMGLQVSFMKVMMRGCNVVSHGGCLLYKVEMPKSVNCPVAVQ